MTAEPRSAAEPDQPTAPPGRARPPVLPAAPGAAAADGPLRRLLLPAGVLAGVVGAFAYVAGVDPNEPGHYPVCPLLRFTGLYCPGCGGLRSAHAFAHGDLVGALGDNAFAVAGYGAFAVVWVLWVVRSVQGRTLRVGLGPRGQLVLGGLLLAFSIVRNLPFGGWLHP